MKEGCLGRMMANEGSTVSAGGVDGCETGLVAFLSL